MPRRPAVGLGSGRCAGTGCSNACPRDEDFCCTGCEVQARAEDFAAHREADPACSLCDAGHVPWAAGRTPMPERDLTREILVLPVFGEDKTCRGHVRIDVDRLTATPIRTEFCITIDTSSFLSSWEARAFAAQLVEAADQADKIAREAPDA